MNNIPFTPFQGTEDVIERQSVQAGFLYFATDSGKIYLDTFDGRIVAGGSGAAVLYANANKVEQDLTDNEMPYIISYSSLEDQSSSPKKDDLIINSNGTFYKVRSYNKETGIIRCKRIAVSGTSSGGNGSGPSGGGSDSDNEVYVTLSCVGTVPNVQTFVHGKSQKIAFKAETSAASKDQLITLNYTITNVSTKNSQIYSYSINSGETHQFDLGAVIEKGINTLVIEAITENSGSNMLQYSSITCIELNLKKSNNFNPLKYAYNQDMSFHFIPVGAVKKTLKVYINGELEIDQPLLSTDTERSMSVTIPKKSHGVYTLKAELEYNRGADYVYSDPLIYQIAFIDENNDSPLIWFDEFPEKIVDNEKLTLNYMVYDPISPNKTSIRRFVNGKEKAKLENISYSDFKWLSWNISDYTLGENEFTLQCESTVEQVKIYVERDEDRDLNILASDLYLNLVSTGRSNDENSISRQEWSFKRSNGEEPKVTFNNFNWYNNGWIVDPDTSDSVLRISNGASIEIPLSIMNQTSLDTNLTFELQFKLRNVQRYENLINITSEEIKNDDGEVVEIKVNKQVKSTEGVWCNYYNKEIGMCLGTQEGFFKSKEAIVSGRFKEEEVVTVSFVIEQASATTQYPLMYMYINGIMSSIIDYNKNSDAFNSEAQKIVINSDYCDVDIYKIRVYKAALSSSDIVHNYIADRKDADLYDMNQIIGFQNNIPLIDYTKMTEYNNAHPEKPLLPYAVLECVDKQEDLLPFIKDGKRYVNVTFVNPSLDYAYEKGLITDEQYVMGCPSYTATNIPFDVQGTSSQGYPRRNYKGKFKKETSGSKANTWTYSNGPLKGKEIGEENLLNGVTYKNYYMDNHYSESTFTWKADYMESSMTHNTGFASFVNILYSKHPLEDYDSSIDVTDRRTTVYGFPMILFQKKADGSYEFIGRYNYNLDKGCNNVIGFKEKTKHKILTDKTYEDVAECWELCNNQGGRTSFTMTNFSEINSKTGELTVIDDFEVRYHKDKDSIEDAIKLEESFGGVKREEANEYILSKYVNLEKVAKWLESTDPRQAKGVALNSPVTFGEYHYVVDEAVNEENFSEKDYYVFNEGQYEKVDTFSAENVYYTKDLIYYNTDNSDYRLAKFAREFDKWFDREYCTIYFIMTELLIQYDSRGKNMMLASWGPRDWEKNANGDYLMVDEHKVPGNYIWYPIFYDIDTQLGVNNSGVPSWEYDTETSPFNGPGVFSTPSSVLWYNFEQCFMTDIKNTYINLRKNNLTYEKLKGYYDYNPEISLSYAMMGDRPINIINVDQYWKYIAPTFSGYIDTSGKIAKDNGTRFYCLQGTRQLQRDLFLRNRFNYMDSKWLAGTYSKEGMTQAFMIRANANCYPQTSDKYLDVAELTSDAQAAGFVKAEWKQSLDTDVVIKVTPYLQQYCTLYFDDSLMTGPEKWNGQNPVDLYLNESAQTAFKQTRSLQEQIFRIGGGEYISSLGDLSKFYINELNLNQLKRLKDLQFGSDDPGYFNKLEIKTFSLNASAYDAEGKPNNTTKSLLEKVVLTNVQQLIDSIDVTGAEKLREFRALGTAIPGVTFADGGQMEIIHLPNTITHITLIEPVSLRGLITNIDEAKDASGKFVNGLYIPGVTTTNNLDSKTSINKLQIIGGDMGYNSYQLLKNLVDIKQSMLETENPSISSDDKNLSISLEKVLWSPYKLVEFGAEQDSDKSYVLKTENSTFTSYTDSDSNNWKQNTLNALIYEVLSEAVPQSDLIKNLELIELFIDEENLQEREQNHFRDIVEYDDNRVTYPYLSGDIFINNDEKNPISELKIKQIKENYYPDLNIYVAYSDPAYTLKMVEVINNLNEGTKQIVELQTVKYDKNDPNQKPISLTDITVKPSRLHHYFKGWSLSEDGDILTKEDIENLEFKDDKVMTHILYAVFELDSYVASFYNGNQFIGATDPVTYGRSFYEIPTIPSRPEEEELLGLTTRIAFYGWSLTNVANPVFKNVQDAQKLVVNVTEQNADEDKNFYAIFVEENVFDRPTDNKYFIFERIGNSNQYTIRGNNDYELTGKITLPATYTNEDGLECDITNIGSFTNAHSAKHIFFMPNGNYTTVNEKAFWWDSTSYPNKGNAISLMGVYLPNTIKTINNYAFANIYTLQFASENVITGFNENVALGKGESLNLIDPKYFTLSASLEHIGAYAFCPSVSSYQGSLKLSSLPNNLAYVGESAFYHAGDDVTISELPNTLTILNYNAFGFLPNLNIATLGNNDGTGLTAIYYGAFYESGYNVKTLRLNSSIKEIGNLAFVGYGKNLGAQFEVENYTNIDIENNKDYYFGERSFTYSQLRRGG